MILQALVKHYETLVEKDKVAKLGWCHAKVSYSLDIDLEGNLLSITFLKEEQIRGEKMLWIPKSMEVPNMVPRAVGILANFLCDNSKYMLGIDSQGTGKRVGECFEAAKEKHLHILRTVETDAAKAVKAFFLKWDPERARENADIAEKWEDITANANLIFHVDMDYVQADKAVREAWESYLDKATNQVSGTCLVTGKKASISRIHSSIKGVQGAQSMGALLVSFNGAAFRSYEKEQSYNAPVSEYAVFAYTTALNYLLLQRNYVFSLGDTTIVFWCEDGEEIYQQILQMMAEPMIDNQREIQNLFQNLQEGKSLDINGFHVDYGKRFYILGLAPNVARLSIRFFYQNSFGDILKNIKAHYDRMEIVRPVWDQVEYLGIWKMLYETVNTNAKDKKPQSNMAASVFHSILSGGRYPENLYQNVLIRIRAEQGGVTRGRTAIIKAHLIHNYQNRWMKEGDFMGLNEECNDVGYLLGRTFAVLEEIQEIANPDINATIKDRYFNSACGTPAQIFPILLKLKNSHIRKFSKEKEGKRISCENKLIKLQGQISVQNNQDTAYPMRLTLETQGMFILGYYHETQKRFEKKGEK